MNLTATVKAKTAWWFRLLMHSIVFLMYVRLISIKAAAKTVCKVSPKAFKYRINNGKWNDLGVQLEVHDLI